MSSICDDPETGSDHYAFPATVGQQSFWYLNQLHPGTSAHHIALRFRVTGPFRRDLFEQCLDELCRRHESLRTTFRHDGDRLIQLVSPAAHWPVRVHDLSDRPAAERDAERLMEEEAQSSFDLEAGPLIRFAILKLSVQSHIILQTVHHIVSDGWSTGIILKEIATLYEAFERGESSPLPEPKLQFADYAVWQNEWLHSDAIKSQCEYWRRALHNASAVLIPHDRIRHPVAREGKIESILFPRELTDSLTKWSVEQGATLFASTLACLYLLVYSRTNRTDLTLGTLIAGRTRTELESVVGLFVNALVLRTDVGGDPTFVELLKRVRKNVALAFENQEVPFGRVVESLPHLEPNQSNPLFRINFLYQRAFLETQRAGSVTIEPIRALSPGVQLDLNFFMVQRDEGWRLSCEYSADEYYPETILRLLLDVQTLIREVVSDPTRSISAILDTALQRPIGSASGVSLPESNPYTQRHESASASVKLNLQIPADILSESSSHNEFESQIRRIWEEVLQVKEIRESSDFFELGGHSLKAAQLLAKLKLQLDVRLTPAWLFQSPTFADMVNAVQAVKIPALSLDSTYSHTNGHSRSNSVPAFANRRHSSPPHVLDKSIRKKQSENQSNVWTTLTQRRVSPLGRRTNPFFFSKSDRPLFGVYEPPPGNDRNEGIVICAPIGHEYTKTHWCLRMLATELAKLGFHVLRFDYSGTGDSWGQFEIASLDQWVTEISSAISELESLASIDRISLVGIRLGATLAYMAAKHCTIHGLILWDPVVKGLKYLNQLRTMQRSLNNSKANSDNFDGEDLLGYSYSSDLIYELNQLNLNQSLQPDCSFVKILYSNEICKQYENFHENIPTKTPYYFGVGTESARWDDPLNFDNTVLLHESRRTIVDFLRGSVQ